MGEIGDHLACVCFWGIFTRPSPKSLAKKHFSIQMPSRYFRKLFQMKYLANLFSQLLEVWEDFFNWKIWFGPFLIFRKD